MMTACMMGAISFMHEKSINGLFISSLPALYHF